MVLFMLVMLYPFWYVLIVSIIDYTQYLTDRIIVIPKTLNLNAYRDVLSNELIYIGLRNSVFVTVVGTSVAIALTVTTAYPLSKTNLRGRRFLMLYFVFTMLFNGGLIPLYILYRNLHLTNTHAASILPLLMTGFYVIITKNYLMGVPLELQDSAKIDGCNELQILVRIMVPLSKPILGTLAIFIGVSYWNQWFLPMVLNTDRSLLLAQNVVRMVVVEETLSSIREAHDVGRQVPMPNAIKAVTIVLLTVPILLVYPLFQKHFTKGFLLGAVKG